MVVNKRNYIGVGIVTGAVACIIQWVFFGDPPFIFPNWLLEIMWIVLHLPIHLILKAIGPPSYLELPFVYLMIFVQWFLVGRVVYWVAFKVRNHEHSAVEMDSKP